MTRIVYADNAATTSTAPSVVKAMLPYFTELYGNPSSLYTVGQEAREGVDHARQQVADAIGALSSEIFFTSGGSEADNWAIKGIAHALAAKGKKHLITSAFEHHAVLHSMEALQKEGFEVTLLPVYENGLVKPQDVADAIRPDTALVSIMYANNEIGTIQPIPEIGAICREKGVLFHTDAVQAIGMVDIDVKAQNIDLLSLSGHKFHGPKGIGALYCRRGLRFPNLIDGGAQELNRRAGTENVPGIVGLGAAIQEATADIPGRTARIQAMRDRLIDGVLQIPRSRLNGDRQHRLAGNANFCFEGIEGESLLLMLDAKGIAASSGSACTSGSLDPSHVLLAIGLPHEIAHGSLRISLSDVNTEEDVDAILEALPPIVERLRAMSPLWERIVQNQS
ncbi:cysteine desulfurase NifS [Solibaculum mannosilyticum]|uniref:Cysteine desulfurase IscS n=2 Tax=Solibaculum mannosilyticum TaxID=2780922 RepID=A0A7I8D232_9FIRM|nr:cysteine desulfurase IscS [Solibaculum mannosilyticum]CZT55398.1 Cysteine desulfurase [Eubacteriaceae bacterium CHKCI005]